MGAERLHDGTPPRRDKASPTGDDPVSTAREPAPNRRPGAAAGDACASSGERPDRATDPEAPLRALLLRGTPLAHAGAAALLLTMAAAPFLKGILAGFALAGAAAAVRDVLGA